MKTKYYNTNNFKEFTKFKQVNKSLKHTNVRWISAKIITDVVQYGRSLNTELPIHGESLPKVDNALMKMITAEDPGRVANMVKRMLAA